VSCPNVADHTSKLRKVYTVLIFFMFACGRDDTSPLDTFELHSRYMDGSWLPVDRGYWSHDIRLGREQMSKPS